jgi:hypothetical protein
VGNHLKRLLLKAKDAIGLSKNSSKGRLYYVCATYKNYGKRLCTSHRINHLELEKIIMEDLNYMISSINNMKNVVDQQVTTEFQDKENIDKTIEGYETELDKLHTRKKAAYRDYREGLITKSEYIDYKEECDKKISLINLKKEDLLKKENKKEPYSPWIQNLLDTKRIDRLDKEIVDEMIDTIYVFEDHTIKIVYNFSDEFEA